MSSAEAEYAMAAVVKPRKVRVKEPPVAVQVTSCCSLFCSPSGSCERVKASCGCERPWWIYFKSKSHSRLIGEIA